MSGDVREGRTPLHAFAHRYSSNGLIISTCLICQKTSASPDMPHLRMAENSHSCSGARKPRETVCGLDITDLFERKLRQTSDRTLIESRCKRCGHVLLGTAVFGDLSEQEAEHFRICRLGQG